jgi:F-type H+-transporting ATPase subunit c
MSTKFKALGLLIFFLVIFSVPMFAQDTDVSKNRATLYMWALIVGGAVIAISSAVGAYCQSRAISSALEGISRNPAAAPHIRFLAIFGLVLIETLVIYALLISIMIIMINWGNYL